MAEDLDALMREALPCTCKGYEKTYGHFDKCPRQHGPAVLSALQLAHDIGENKGAREMREKLANLATGRAHYYLGDDAAEETYWRFVSEPLPHPEQENPDGR